MKKRNYILLISSTVVILIGFILMSSPTDPTATYWNPEVFNTTTMYISPIVLLIGYGLVGFSIMNHSTTAE